MVCQLMTRQLKNESSRRKIYVSKEVLNEVLMYCEEVDTYIFTTTKGKHCSLWIRKQQQL